MMFEWNGEKAKINDRKHGVSFYEAMTAFSDPCSLIIPDPAHSIDEDRFVLLGISDRARLLVVVHAERGENVRIISSRQATRTESKVYES